MKQDLEGELYGLERLQTGLDRRREVPLQGALEALDDEVAVLGIEMA